MKLSDAQLAATRESLGATPVPDDHPVMEQLREAFGEHTYFLDSEGLSVFVDQAEAPQEAELTEDGPRLVMLAAWTDENRSTLGAVEPVDRGVTLPAPPPNAA